MLKLTRVFTLGALLLLISCSKELPFARASVNTQYPDVNTSVIFQNLSLNYSDVNWDFGDGNTSNSFDPTHQYEKRGTYYVTLTIKDLNGIGSDKVVFPIYVRNPNEKFIGEYEIEEIQEFQYCQDTIETYTLKIIPGSDEFEIKLINLSNAFDTVEARINSYDEFYIESFYNKKDKNNHYWNLVSYEENRGVISDEGLNIVYSRTDINTSTTLNCGNSNSELNSIN